MLYFVTNPEHDGSGRAAICTNPNDVVTSTVWSHTVTSADIKKGKPGILKVCSIAYTALKGGKSREEASKEAGV